MVSEGYAQLSIITSLDCISSYYNAISLGEKFIPSDMKKDFAAASDFQCYTRPDLVLYTRAAANRRFLIS